MFSWYKSQFCRSKALALSYGLTTPQHQQNYRLQKKRGAGGGREFLLGFGGLVTLRVAGKGCLSSVHVNVGAGGS